MTICGLQRSLTFTNKLINPAFGDAMLHISGDAILIGATALPHTVQWRNPDWCYCATP